MKLTLLMSHCKKFSERHSNRWEVDLFGFREKHRQQGVAVAEGKGSSHLMRCGYSPPPTPGRFHMLTRGRIIPTTGEPPTPWSFFFFFYCSGFCHTLKWNSHGFTCVLHPDPPSHLPLHPIPPGLPSAPGPSACLMHPTWAGDLFHPR